MNPGIVNVSSTTASDGFNSLLAMADPVEAEKPASYLDSPDNQRLLRRLEDWWTECREAHAENRREQMIDADYYDSIQWLASDAQILVDRGQAPLTFPIIKQMCDWVIGTERRTRIDWDVLPRKDSDVEMATTKKEVMKWVSDINGAAWERSQQFNDQVKVGIGWTEECYNNDRKEEPVTVRHQDWKGMWWDPFSRSNTMRDCRYIKRAKWLDLDYGISMFPDRADELAARAVDTMDSAMEMLVLETSLPQMFYNTPNPFLSTRTTGMPGMFGSAMVARKARRRVLVIETWFRRVANSPLLLGDGPDDVEVGSLHRQPFDAKNEAHQKALADGVVSLVDSITEQMWCAMWTPGALLRVYKSPYKHNRFPFTPAWGYRRHRDGMPYGLIRPSRDAQDEYNKRRSKILFDLSTSQVIYTSDAMDEADEENNLEEAKRPDGEIRLASGKMDQFKIDRGTDRVNGQIQMLAEAKQNIYETSGVTRENTGTSSGDQSGRAILAKQQQGSVTTAELFDNYRQAIQESGLKTLSNCEAFLSLPKVVRIVGADGAMAWLAINQPEFDPATGQVLWNNDITASEADFIVDETDYRETVRMAMSEMLFEMVGRMPPDVAMALLDIAVEMTDLPNKRAIAQRIRQVTGQTAPGQENSPEAQAQAEAKQQQEAQQEQERQQQVDANIRLTNAKTVATQAKANLDNANAAHTDVRGKTDALHAASMVAQAPGLAPAADKLWNPAEAFPAQPNQFSAAM
ncbi:hypothetical protein [Dyella japonica]|uniref:portal protein n=1 Tax=Dyella japonica TaxID=231455 RepID=UPI00062CFF9D|nr:hypothetical protein [Dyella japonica]